MAKLTTEQAREMNWIICEWPDGTWCDVGELGEYAHMSDDYQRRRVLEWDEGYCPTVTEAI